LVATLYLGILPNRVLQIAQHSAQDLLLRPSAANSTVVENPYSVPVAGR